MMPVTVDEPMNRSPLTIRLCGPRGFCAGVDRAIQIVVLALKKYGAPVYVRHEIVHNRFVVEGLEALGAVFVEELDEIPQEHHAQPVIFSAHGVAKIGARGCRGAQAVLSRRHLSAGLESA
jgi:4-hydroxy-3-methylbut-2-enyl diphosphate reductase